jgi:hypothetical protein
MNKILKIMLVLLVFLVMPVVMGVVVIKLFVGGHGVILAIGFFILVVLGILASVNRFIAYNKSKKQEEGFKKEN